IIFPTRCSEGVLNPLQTSNQNHMALSRIWSAFIIVAILVAAIRMLAGDEKIFARMVVGKSSDKYDSVFYYAIGSPVNQRLSSKYGDFLKEYGYYKTDSVNKASVLLAESTSNDSIMIVKGANPQVEVYTYVSV